LALAQQVDRAGAVPVVKERSAGRRIPLPAGARVVTVDGSGSTLPWVRLGVESGVPSAAGNGPLQACGGGTTTPPASTGGSGSFSLKSYEGYRFSDRKVVASDDKTADVSFYPSFRYTVPTAMLGAPKIQEYEQKPDTGGLAASQIDGWYYATPAPAAGYWYVVRGADGRYYLLQLTKFENAGAATSQWQISFTWEQVQVKP
jgi:hypothetical protein